VSGVGAENERVSSAEQPSAPAREDYAYALAIPTRWLDNDAHGHVNNVEYYSFFDTVVTTWLIAEAGHDVRAAPVIGVCIESQCTFHAALTFPEVIDARMRVGRIGRTSVRYEVALFAGDGGPCAATGHFVHVYVDRDARRPTPVPEALRAELELCRR
jgi:acyl-CoA thioester hydrolase